MTKAEALHAFFSSFDIPAYEEHSVPVWLDDAQTQENRPPYITYELLTAERLETVQITVNVWDISDSWRGVNAKAAEIGAAVGRFKVLNFTGGAVVIAKGEPFAQSFADGVYKRKILNLELTYITGG